MTIELEQVARSWIAERGYDQKMGARPMARVIQDHIKRPLAEELLFGELVNGGHVRIDLNSTKDKLDLIIESLIHKVEHVSEMEEKPV